MAAVCFPYSERLHKIASLCGAFVFLAWIFELSGGAIGDYDDTAIPKEQREAIWTVAALHQWDMGIDDPRCITTAEDVSQVGDRITDIDD